MKKKVLIVLLLAALLAAYVWWPRSMAGLVDTSIELEVSFQPYTGRPSITVEPGTAEMEAVQAVLEQYRYTIYWKSLPFIQDSTDYRINLGGPDITLRDASGKGFHIVYEGERFYILPSVRVGCMTDPAEEPGTALYQELMDALEIE